MKGVFKILNSEILTNSGCEILGNRGGILNFLLMKSSRGFVDWLQQQPDWLIDWLTQSMTESFKNFLKYQEIYAEISSKYIFDNPGDEILRKPGAENLKNLGDEIL